MDRACVLWNSVLSNVIGNEVFNVSRGLMPLQNLSYILEEVNRNGQYKKVIFDLDAFYFEDENKGNIGTDANLLFKLTENRRLSHILDVVNFKTYSKSFKLKKRLIIVHHREEVFGETIQQIEIYYKMIGNIEIPKMSKHEQKSLIKNFGRKKEEQIA